MASRSLPSNCVRSRFARGALFAPGVVLLEFDCRGEVAMKHKALLRVIVVEVGRVRRRLRRHDLAFRSTVACPSRFGSRCEHPLTPACRSLWVSLQCAVFMIGSRHAIGGFRHMSLRSWPSSRIGVPRAFKPAFSTNGGSPLPAGGRRDPRASRVAIGSEAGGFPAFAGGELRSAVHSVLETCCRPSSTISAPAAGGAAPATSSRSPHRCDGLALRPRTPWPAQRALRDTGAATSP